ncbi:hypothetical protein FKW77_006112 [Venturia effusa]|uniref:Uncharacterized protein n=1 Tax=Venturia effusa TaxID=50376 RepID=A0A517L5L3_9PEZI|nr:hypothetical protein FKW77_006112 [Venturia effusa]
MDDIDDIIPPNIYSDPGAHDRAIAFQVLLAILLVSTSGVLLYSILIRRRNSRPSQVYGGHNVEAAYLRNNNLRPARSRAANTVRTAAGQITHAMRGRRTGNSMTRNNPEEIELPSRARVYNGPGLSDRGVGVTPRTSRIGLDAERKREDNIQHRRRDSKIERQKRQSTLMARDTAPLIEDLRDDYIPFERFVTFKEALAMDLDDREKEGEGGMDFGAEVERKDFV